MVASYLFVLRRRVSFLVCWVAVLAPLAFFVVQSRPAEYTSVAVVEVGTGNVAEQVIGQQRGYEEPERRVATEADAVTSRPVAERAAERLGGQAGDPDVDALLSRVTARPRTATNYIDISGTGPTARSAQQLTQAFADAFLDYRQGLQRADLEGLERDLVEQRREAEAALAALPVGEDTARERAVLSSRIDNAVRLLEAVRLRSSIEQTGVELLSAPSIPKTPSNATSTLVTAVVAVVGAVLLGLALAFGLDVLRDGVRTRREVEALTGAPVIATVRRLRKRQLGRDPQPPAVARALRLGLTVAHGDVLPTRVTIVAIPGEGDDSRHVAAVVAQTYRDSGSRVLLFADTAGDITSAASLSATSGGDVQPLGDGVVVRQSVEPDVWLGPATGQPGAPGLFDVAAPAHMLDMAARDFGAVIIVAETDRGLDPLVISHVSKSVVIVCGLGRTSARKLAALKDRLHQAGRKIDAVVLTEDAPRVLRTADRKAVDLEQSRQPAGQGADLGSPWPPVPVSGRST